MFKTKFLTCIFLFTLLFSYAQNNLGSLNKLDILNYKLIIDLNDSTNIIDAQAKIDLKFKQKLSQFNLDFYALDSLGLGMNVAYVLQNTDTVKFSHSNNSLLIFCDSTNTTDNFEFTIAYSGVPQDGLIISKNIYGDRTFFGDNWPNRAHNWFPCIDHPSDKATVDYVITAPNTYQIIANGLEVEETNLTNLKKLYHYKTTVPIPTKVMVFGAARFAVQNLGETHQIPISTWVYPQNKDAGFYDFAVAQNILNFFVENIGDYPFQKLANVQSKTRFGGMENAGNIFYFEKSVTGKQEHEDLIAHEIAHQWFGNSASEKDWPHLWLSEGFATYLTNLYMLEAKGEAVFKNRLKNERNIVIKFFETKKTPVVDYETKNLMALLNANSYQKGSWFLHMLKNKIGTELFWQGLKNYYNKYKFSNATTQDFKAIMAQTANINLDFFFNQWLEKPGHPILKTNWIYNNGILRVLINQTQETVFEFDIEVEIEYNDGTKEIRTITVEHHAMPYELTVNKEVKSIVFDPNVKLLFEHLN